MKVLSSIACDLHARIDARMESITSPFFQVPEENDPYLDKEHYTIGDRTWRVSLRLL
jgi:hypothetical protein